MKYYQIYGNLYVVREGRNRYSIKNLRVIDGIYKKSYGAVQMIEDGTYGVCPEEKEV